MARKEKITICLSSRLLELLNGEAFRARRSRSSMVEVLLIEALEEEEEQGPRLPPMARAVR
jgi:metal-responsive CopG/Arc/MetJ family transcriptional regulator